MNRLVFPYEGTHLPADGGRSNAIVWIAANEAGVPLPINLDGAHWFRMVELHEPTYEGLHEGMPEGLYLLDVEVGHRVDSQDAVDDVVVRVHRYVRLPSPTRDLILDEPFETFTTVCS